MMVLGGGECPVCALQALGDGARGDRDEVGAAVMIDVGKQGVPGGHATAEDRGHIGKTVAPIIPVEVEAVDYAADEKVRPAITVVVDGVRAA
jgi:hypothetical protein